MDLALGIDFGEYNTVSAICLNGRVTILQNCESQDLTPSVLGVYKKQFIVGQLAIDRMLMAPKDKIISIKRLMGRGFCGE